MKALAKTILVVGFALLLTSCITTSRSTTESAYIPSSSGAVLRIISNYKGIPPLSDLEIWFRDQGFNVNSGKIFLRKSGDLVFVDLAPGEYKLQRIDMGNYFFPLTEDSHFIVEENNLTYIGDLHIEVKLGLFSIKSEGIYVRDEYTEVSELVKVKNPDTSLRRNLMKIKVDEDHFHIPI